jgi:phosphatidate cytidylyltransferase
MGGPHKDQPTSEGPPAQSGAGGSAWRDLAPRVASGIVLALIALLAEWSGPQPFALLVAVIGAIMSWEWGRIVRGEQWDRAFYFHAGTVVVAAGLAVYGQVALAILAAVIGAIVVAAMQFAKRAVLSAFGVLYVAIPAVALIWLRRDEPYGIIAVLFLIAAVSATDIGAYVVGRAVGGPRLWPRISPGKTWSGLAGGVVSAMLVGVLFSQFISGAAASRMALTGLALGLVSQAGDLAESALKREHGIKDASGLIPGHGGFLDRLDGLVAAAALVAFIAMLLNARAPARALLFWF